MPAKAPEMLRRQCNSWVGPLTPDWRAPGFTAPLQADAASAERHGGKHHVKESSAHRCRVDRRRSALLCLGPDLTNTAPLQDAGEQQQAHR